MDLIDRVRGQLESWGLDGTIEGAQALDIAMRLVADEELRPAAAAMLHAQLTKVVADLRRLAPPEDADDDVADLQGAYQGLRAVQ
jgi:hypothetical protein